MLIVQMFWILNIKNVLYETEFIGGKQITFKQSTA